MGSSCRSVFPNTLTWAQQEWEQKEETDEEGKKRGVSIESKEFTKERTPDGLSVPNQNTILINIILFYKIWNKYNEIQLTKNKMGLDNPRMTNHPSSPNLYARWGTETEFKFPLMHHN